MSSSLILDVWREVGRHLELPELLERVYPRLEEALELRQVLVRRIDATASCVETVASAAAAGASPPALRSAIAPSLVPVLVSWARSGAPVEGASRAAALGLGALLPEDLPAGAVIAAPLSAGEAPRAAGAGVLLAVSASPRGFSPRQARLVRGLREPVGVALENHDRVHELRRLREAAEADNRALLARLGRPSVGDVIVGADGALKPVLERVDLVARSDAPVLILGETGSGKEVIARAIHARSPRASGPMIRVNCGAIPHELVDSELFGHERGSFTGAVASRRGWFERADGGTLFLDEIGELPAAAQVRLLRILQDGSFERVGGQAPVVVHVRLVAATHRDLPAMVREGRFREDLWYRVCVFPIHLPPLRERRDDLPALAAHFALKAARRLGLAPALPTSEDLRLLCAYAWPGNVRELASVIERAAILGDGRYLEIEKSLGGIDLEYRASPTESDPAEGRLAPGETLDRAMGRHIEAALRASLGRIEGPFGAAQRLRINPHTLRARMRKLGVDWKRFRPGPRRPR